MRAFIKSLFKFGVRSQIAKQNCCYYCRITFPIDAIRSSPQTELRLIASTAPHTSRSVQPNSSPSICEILPPIGVAQIIVVIMPTILSIRLFTIFRLLHGLASGG